MRMRFGLGFALGAGTMPNANTIYWGGHGGSLVLIDMDARTSFAFAMNQISPTVAGDGRALGLALEMWTAMGLI